MQKDNSGQFTFEPRRAPVVSYEMKLCENCPRNFSRVKGSKDRYCRSCHAMAVMTPQAGPAARWGSVH